MPLTIVPIDAEDMFRTQVLSRAKNPTMQALYREIFDLLGREKGAAREIVLDYDEDFDRIRALLAQCSKRTGIELWVVPDRIKNRIMFTLKNTQGGRKPPPPTASPTPRDQEEARLRADAIKDAALELARQRPVVSAQEVVDHLRMNGVNLEVRRPTTSVSAVMRNMREFEHTDMGQFRYRAY